MSSMTNYMTNSSEVDLGDDELLQKNVALTKENETISQELQEKEKQMKELQRKFDDLKIEFDHQAETAKNNENLLSFYKNQSASPNLTLNTAPDSQYESDTKVKDLEVKLLMAEDKNDELEENIKDLTDRIEKLTEQVKELNEEKKDLNDTHEKLLNMLTEKEVENNELKEKLRPEEQNAKSSNEDEVNELKDQLRNIEEEYELYKIDSDTQINKLSKEKEELQREQHELKSKLIDIENENQKLRDDITNLELEKNQLEAEKMNIAADNDGRNELIAEIEILQNKLQELRDSKDKSLMTTEQEKSAAINERKEIEALYTQVKDQKFELEKQLTALRQSSQRELNAVTEKAKNDLNQKQNEINKISESLTKAEKATDAIKREIEKKEKMLAEQKEELISLKKENENLKIINEKTIHEMQVKFDMEKNAMNTRMKELNHKLEDANKEINNLKQAQYMSTNNGFNLEDVLEGGNDKEKIDDLQKQIDEKEKIIFQMKQEQKYYEKTINELKSTVAKFKADSAEKEKFAAENKCLNGNIDAMKKQLDAFKAQREKAENEFKEEIKTQMDAAAAAKCQLGMISFEKEQEILKCKRYIKKLQAKLVSLGVVFGKKTTKK